MLELVDYPVVVNADEQLIQVAADRGWPNLDWH
jgi:phosphoserine phosphatase